MARRGPEMARESKPVAKARVRVRRAGGEWLLMSRKRAPGGERHDKLEMLGGHLNPREAPLEALIRELREEEVSGRLAAAAARSRPRPLELVADGTTHYLFDLEIGEEEFAQLKRNPRESLRFELVLRDPVEGGELDESLTPRSRKIFRELRKREVKS